MREAYGVLESDSETSSELSGGSDPMKKERKKLT